MLHDFPVGWKTFKMHYRYRETVYHVFVSQTRAADNAKIGATSVTVDGIERHDQAVLLVDDRQERSVEVKNIGHTVKTPNTPSSIPRCRAEFF